VLFEQTDEWASRHRHMQVEAFPKIDTAEVDTIPGMTTEPPDHALRPSRNLHQPDGRDPAGAQSANPP
jgi:hypothetical protein